MPSKTDTMARWRAAKTLAEGLAADPALCNLLANLHRRPMAKVDLEKVVKTSDL